MKIGNIQKVRINQIIIILIWLILIFYNFHRYLFKYNSSGTSPTYEDTPASWQIGKYIAITILLILFYAFSIFKKTSSYWPYIYFFIFLFLLLVNVFGFLFYNQLYINELSYIYFSFLLFPYFFLSKSIKDYLINFDFLLKLTAILLYIFNAIAVFNFLYFKRLPALAYDGSLVRFGSFWDDPNSFAIVCVFFSFYFFNQKRKLLFILSVINLILTFSFSGYFLFLFSFTFWSQDYFLKFKKRWINFFFILIICVCIFSFYFNDLIINLYYEKKLSIDAHLNSSLHFNFFPLQNSFFQFSENWYKSFFINYFPISLIVFFFILLFFLKVLFTRDNIYIRYYLIISIISFFFIPFLYSFPLNFLILFIVVNFIKQNC